MDGSYPAIFLNGRNTHIHRLEWIKHYGEIPKTHVVHHKNGNKLDWNIENLQLVTRGEHISHHRHEQKRSHLRGDKSLHRKLTQKDVDYIRRVYVKGDTEFGGHALSEKFNVTEGCISAIVRGVTWKGVVS
jgi:hypothetical protein